MDQPSSHLSDFTRTQNQSGHHRVQRQFGAQANRYAVSTVHQTGESLEIVRRYVGMGNYHWALDIGTGTGFTAFELAPFAKRVLASDVTSEMLVQTQKLTTERGLSNVETALVAAEALPFGDSSIDCIASRTAAHHFHNVEDALDEMVRVLSFEGTLILCDTVAPPDAMAALWQDDVERRRDPSHVRNLSLSQWISEVQVRGLKVSHLEMARVPLTFDDWVERSGTPVCEVDILRSDFLDAPDYAIEAFGIHSEDGDIAFKWDAVVLKAVKGN
jgi:ubiquinone/menaquinone biosynthesis C-methylase UbiE